MPVNMKPLGAPAYVYVSALHQRWNARAIFRRPYKTPSGPRNPSRVRRPNGPCYDTSAVRDNEDGSEIGRALTNHDIRDKLETNEIYSLTLRHI